MLIGGVRPLVRVHAFAHGLPHLAHPLARGGILTQHLIATRVAAVARLKHALPMRNQRIGRTDVIAITAAQAAAQPINRVGLAQDGADGQNGARQPRRRREQVGFALEPLLTPHHAEIVVIERQVIMRGLCAQRCHGAIAVVHTSHGEHRRGLRRGQKQFGATVACCGHHQHAACAQRLGREANGIVLPGLVKVAADAYVEDAYAIARPAIVLKQPLHPRQNVAFRDAPVAPPHLNGEQARIRRKTTVATAAQRAVARGHRRCHLAVPGHARAVPQTIKRESTRAAAVGQVHIIGQTGCGGLKMGAPLEGREALPGNALRHWQAAQVGMGVEATVEEAQRDALPGKRVCVGQPLGQTEQAFLIGVIVGESGVRFGAGVEREGAAAARDFVGRLLCASWTDAQFNAPGRLLVPDGALDGGLQIAGLRNDPRVSRCTAERTSDQEGLPPCAPP